MATLLNPTFFGNAVAVLFVVAVVALLVVAAVWLIRTTLSVKGWLEAATKSMQASVADLSKQIGDRFRDHEAEEREWQGAMEGKLGRALDALSEVRERLIRVETKLEAAEQERIYRHANESRGAPRVEE